MSSVNDGNETRGPAMLAITWTGAGLSVLLISLRFYCRLKLRILGPDDWIMLASVILMLIGSGLLTQAVHVGAFRHFASLSAEQLQQVTLWQYISQPAFVINYGVSKVATGLLVARLISGPGSKFRLRLLYTILALAMLVAIANAVSNFAQCTPSAALWTPELLPTASCWPPQAFIAFIYFCGGFHIFVDFFLAALPAAMIWKLKLSRRKQINLSIVLSLGIFAGAVGLSKMPYQAAITGAGADPTWDVFPIYAFTIAEIYLIIYAGCIPTLKPILDMALRGKISSSNDRSYGTGVSASRDARSKRNTMHTRGSYGIKLNSLSADEPETLVHSVDKSIDVNETEQPNSRDNSNESV